MHFDNFPFCTTFIGGMALGYIAITYGLIFAVAALIIHNLFSKLLGKFL